MHEASKLKRGVCVGGVGVGVGVGFGVGVGCLFSLTHKPLSSLGPPPVMVRYTVNQLILY